LHGILGGFCHQYRNHLNSLKMSLYLACGPDSGTPSAVWREVEPRYTEVERFIDRLQLICRPTHLSLVRLALDLLIEERQGGWSDGLAARGRSLLLRPPEVVLVGEFDPTRLAQGLDDLVSWRAAVGDPATDLRLTWSSEGGLFHLVWDEPAQVEPGSGPRACRGFEVGGDPTENDGDRSASLCALTLPLLTRIISLHGGTVGTTSGESWRLDLRWPLDVSTSLREPPCC
jgi:hypothetical protein